MEEMMRVVFVGDYPYDPEQISGGVEAVVLYLTRALQSYADLTLDVITLGKRGTVKRTVLHDKVTVHHLPSSRLPSRLSIWDNIRRLRAEILRLGPDLVHAHIAGQYAEAAALTGLPWVLTPHGIRFLEASLWPGVFRRVYRGTLIKWEELRSVKRAKYLIAISPFIQQVFHRHLTCQIYAVENPIADAFFHVTPEVNECYGQLLFVGRLIPRKGIHTLLRAFARLHQRMPEATLRLAGGSRFSNEPSGYHRQLRQFVADAGLENAVTFLGPLHESALLQEYGRCSAVVLASVLETAPMAIMQAMAAGKAVVSTDAGGIRHLIEHGRMGLIVPPENDLKLAEALHDVLSDNANRQAMGGRSKAAARRRFFAPHVAAQTRDVYYDILGQTSSRAKNDHP